jgi:hypothetical protein
MRVLVLVRQQPHQERGLALGRQQLQQERGLARVRQPLHRVLARVIQQVGSNMPSFLKATSICLELRQISI